MAFSGGVLKHAYLQWHQEFETECARSGHESDPASLCIMRSLCVE